MEIYKGFACCAAIAICLIASPALATMPLVQRYMADQKMRPDIAANCENPALKLEKIEVVLLNYHMIARLTNKCESGKYGPVCKSFVLSLHNSTCRDISPLSGDFGLFEGGKSDIEKINKELPLAHKVPRDFISGKKRNWSAVLVKVKSGEAIILESKDEIRIFLVE